MFLDITIHPLYKVFDFWVQSVIKLINFMRTIEIFPHISLWDTMIALAIIDIVVYIVKFGIHRYVVFGKDIQWINRQYDEMYQPKHVYQGKHSPGNASYKPRHAKRR